MPNYLALDASTEACSVALSLENNVTSEFELCPQSHSIVLLPMIDRLLKDANVKLAELDGLIFGRGPGSFTGVRIGVGVAQGVAFSAELPVVGVSTLQTMAQLAYEKYQQEEVIATIDARMSEVYAGFYRLNKAGVMTAVVEDTVLPPSKLAQYLAPYTTACYGVGSGWDAYQSELESLKTNKGSPDILFPNAKVMLPIAEQEFKNGNAGSAEEAQPVYVRDTVSWKKLPGRE